MSTTIPTPSATVAAAAQTSQQQQGSTMTPAIKIIPNNKLYVSEPNPRWFGNGANARNDPAWTNANWLKSRFHFNFAEYHNPHNTGFGVLKVMNDDLVQPHRGFGEHPHHNMEIITYIVQGQLTHQDSMGTKESLGRGSIQFMTAGSGIEHSEANHGDKPLRFIQTWIKPSKQYLTPNYGSFEGSRVAADRTNSWYHLVSGAIGAGTSNDRSDSGDIHAAPVQINQDADLFVTELEEGKSVSYDLAEGRQAYMLCLEGSVKVNGKMMHRHDACEIVGGGKIDVEAIETEDTESGPRAHVMMYTMAEVKGSGRRDIVA